MHYHIQQLMCKNSPLTEHRTHGATLVVIVAIDLAVSSNANRPISQIP